ncbi:MAG: sialate O-acetylesterase [Bryobacteraceae bacterium]
MKILLSLFLYTAVTLQAAGLRITGGAVHNQVFQRGSQNSADVPVSGEGDNGQQVEVRLMKKHSVVPGFDWTPLGRVQGGKWNGVISGVPTGGPYGIQVRSGNSQAALAGLLVGDLWVLAGQSNMQGVGDLINVVPPHDLVHNFDMSDQWVIAEEPLHTLANATDPVHWGRNANKQPEKLEGERLRKMVATRTKGAGLGMAFAVEMVKRTGVPVGLLSCAHGGTSMDQWDPAKRDQGGDSLYGSMYRRVKAAGGDVTGVLWYQGESDSSPAAAPLYQGKFERFIAAVRSDFGKPNLPFYYVQIGRFINNTNPADWNLVQDVERKIEQTIPNTGVVAAIDLELDDLIHVGTDGLKTLGRRLALLATNGARRGPRPVKAKLEGGVIRVTFSDVNGRLTGAGPLTGFTVHDQSGQPVPMIYKIRVDPADGSALLLYHLGKLSPGAMLRYGYGKDPYCNVRDEAGMALPVFGPMPIE